MRKWWMGVAALAALGCGLETGGDGAAIDLPDGSGDARTADGSQPDTSTTDGGSEDATLPDAHQNDANTSDAADGATTDATLTDASASDSSVVDSSVVDSSVIDSSVIDSSVIDSSIVDSGACTQHLNACLNLKLPNIWTPIAFNTSGAVPCAAGFNTPANPVENPIAGAGTCTCQASQNTYSCTTGQVQLSVGNNNCNGMGPSFTSTSGACANAQGAIAGAMSFTNLGLSGACSATPKLDTTKLSATTTTTCQAVCQDDVCAGKVPQGWLACVVATGVQSCPSSFPSKHTVGDAPTASCANSCSCSTPTCGTPSLTFYQNQNCQNFADSISGTGCLNPSQTNQPFQSVKYASTMSAVTFGTSAATAGVTNTKTICCQ